VAVTPAPGASSPALRRAADRPRPRVMFYSHDGFGLGHIRITLAMAHALAALRPDASLLAVTGSPQAHAYEMPPNFDYIKMPTASKGMLYADLPAHRELPLAQTGVWFVREAVIRRATAAFQPDLFIVDHAATGHLRELSRALRELKATKPEATLILELTDIINDPKGTRDDWKRTGAYQIMDELYDRVVVFGSADVFDLVAEYQLPPSVAAKTEYVGYMRRHDPIAPSDEIRAQLGVGDAPLIVLTTGGGADGGRDIQMYLRAARAGLLGGAHSFIVTGPLLEGGARSELERLASGLPNLTLVPFTSELMSYMNAADLVISKCGYNAMCEVLSLGKRSLVIPRATMWKEQVVRAERFAALGLVTMIHPTDLTPEHLAATIWATLNEPPPQVTLDFGGLERAGDIFSAALPR
jgi:predicted glycosyltransferase